MEGTEVTRPMMVVETDLQAAEHKMDPEKDPCAHHRCSVPHGTKIGGAQG